VGVILAASCAITYNFLFAFLLAKRKYMAERALSLVFDNLTVIAGSLWVNWKMGAAGYENDLWLVFIPIIVSNSLYYGPVASLFFTVLWTGLFVAQSVVFYDADSYYRQQLPTRLVFFVLTGFVSYSLSAELRQRRQNLERKSRQSLQMLAQIVEARDTDAGLHLRHIQYYSRALALRLGVDEQQADEIAYAAMIHDVGKAQVADSILKKPGPLTPDERQEIQKHTVWADTVLSEDEEFATARDVARHHHERWDGTGYPDGLAGESIPFAARIVAVADVYDALISERPYKHGWPASDAIVEIRRLSGSHLDPLIVEAFVDLYATNVLRDLDVEMERDPESGAPHAAAA
jgi:HD-GYP domain-containing protein (c-di-GMP phosphodiesterase class II)